MKKLRQLIFTPKVLFFSLTIVVCYALIFSGNQKKESSSKKISNKDLIKNYKKVGIPTSSVNTTSTKYKSRFRRGISSEDRSTDYPDSYGKNPQSSDLSSNVPEDFAKKPVASPLISSPDYYDHSSSFENAIELADAPKSENPSDKQIENKSIETIGGLKVEKVEDPKEEGSESKKGNGNSYIPIRPNIYGVIPPLKEYFKTTSVSLITKAYAAPLDIDCSEAKVELFDLATMTPLADNPLSGNAVEEETFFEFDPFGLSLDMQAPTKYFLRTSGCNHVFERIVTSFTNPQDITQASTLISQVVKTKLKEEVNTINGHTVSSMITELERQISTDEDLSETYLKLQNSTTISDTFDNSFSDAHTILENSLPDIKEISVPKSLIEKTNYIFSIQAYDHWSVNYEIAYEWYMEDLKSPTPPVLMSNSANWSYTPSANHSDEFIISLVVGKSDGSGNVIRGDTDIPYHEFSWKYPDETIGTSFTDSYPVTAPTIQLAPSQNNPTNNLAINLEVLTGPEQSPGIMTNCETLSLLAITESSAAPTPAEFNINCTDENLQNIIKIVTAGDGARKLYLWAIDHNSKISSPREIDFVIDQTPPQINIPAIAALRADTYFNLAWNVSEQHGLAILPHTIEIQDTNGTSWTTLSTSTPSADGVLLNNAFNYGFTLPDRAQTNTKIRISLSDALGNTSTAESNIFELQKALLSTSPSSYDFSGVPNNSISSAQSFTITNSGTGITKNCTPPQLSGTNASEFQILNDSCGSNNLMVNQSCTYGVQAIPTTKGPKSATLTWACDTDITSVNLSYISENVIPTTASDLSITTDEDTPINFNVNASTDTDADPLTYTVITPPANGILTNCLANNNDLNCDYTPNSNYFGTDSFTYKTNDGTADSAGITTVTITVNSINDTPTIPATQAVATNEDTPITFDLNLGSDIDGDTLTYHIATTPSNGGISCTGGTSRSCTYTPNLNFNGTDTFTYYVNDGTINSSTSAVTITVNAVNDLPVMAADFSITTPEDAPINFNVAAASDVDLDTLTYTIITPPSNGLLTNCMAADGDLNCDYSPNLNYNGVDTFTYRAYDGTADAATVTTVTINITPVNDTPTIPATQSLATNEDTPITFDLNLGSDIDGDTLTYHIATTPSNGGISCTGGTSRSCTYTPNLNFNGTDTFTYYVNDGTINSSTSTVTITVNAVNDLPVMAADFSITTPEDTPINFNVAAASDVDPDTLTYTIITPPSNGLLTNCMAADGDLNCDYSPNLNYNGVDTFTYRANDGTADAASVTTVTINITAVNDAPTLAATQSITTDEDTPITFDLNAGVDVDGDTLNYTITLSTGNGFLSCDEGTSRSCTYTPSANFNGSDDFTYQVSDGEYNSTTATVNITINALNDAPVAAADSSLTFRDNTLYTINLDPGSDVETATGSLQYKITQAPSVGTLSNCIDQISYGSDLICDYIAPVNTNTTVTIKYVVYDGQLESSTETTLTITINDETSTTPSLTPVNFIAGTSTSSNPMTLTAASCDDISEVLISESTTTPLSSDPSWQACSTTVAAISYDPSILNTQGYRTLRIYGKDPVGNISAYDSIDFIYDSLAPSLSFDDVPTLPWGINYAIKWKTTEATVSATKNHTFSVSYNGGSTWTQLGLTSVATDGPHSDTPYSYNYTVPSGTLYNDVRFKVTLTDDNGMTGEAISNSFRIVEDLGAPFIHTATFKINGSTTPTPTAVKYVSVEFDAEDLDTVITHFCLKGNDTTQPNANDDCWKAMDAPSPGLSLNTFMEVRDYSFLLGFAPSNFKVSVWVKDLAGNISSNPDATLGKDFVTMNYTPDQAPVISEFFVTNSDSPSNPVEDIDLTFNNGDTVYISWRTVDNKTIPNGTTKLFYTTDDIEFHPIAAAQNLDNGANNCPQVNSATNTLDDNATACYQWTFPLTDGQYFRLSVTAADSANQDTSATSVALNSTKFKILAGNVDPGTGSSAKSAQLFPKATQAPYSLAVTSDGKIFFNDKVRGVLYINPFTNVLEQLIPIGEEEIGDGVTVDQATVMNVRKITMDFQDRLLIWDENSIRRVDTTVVPMTIETIIGMKADGTIGTNRSDIILDPRDFNLNHGNSYSMFQPLPNGDIWFNDQSNSVNSNNLIRIYKGSLSSPRIESRRISGIGGSAPPTSAISGNTSASAEMDKESIAAYQIGFDVNTSEVTSLFAKYYRGLNGCSYYMREEIDPSTFVATGVAIPSHDTTCVDAYGRSTNDGSSWGWSYHIGYATRVNRYNPTTNSYEATKLGNGIHGTCPDGTLATSCPIRLQDFFVNKDGVFFFVDANTIRVIDAQGKVQTLYGQTQAFGDNGLGQDARFGNIQFIDHGVGDNVVLVDSQERIIREVQPNESVNQVIRVAGNGVLARGSFSISADPRSQMLDTANWSQNYSMATNPANGDIYFPCRWDNVCRLSRATNQWSHFMGQNGGGSWTTTATVDGLTIDMGNYAPSVNGFYNGGILTGHYSWSGTAHNNSIFRFTTTNGMSQFIAGTGGGVHAGSGSCPVGPGENCVLRNVRQHWNASTWDSSAGKILFEMEYDRSGAKTFRHLSNNNTSFSAFNYGETSFSSIVKVGTLIYGCTEEYELVKWDTISDTRTVLPIPGTAACHGYRILYKPAANGKPNRLVFPFHQNGLHGIAEYFLN
ncbi:tandem-95 repeat protein [Halobacteriovorax sp. HFRX-2_2]|uniref:tandem-95 repeat protein n=1 Tax=unclassified Halobacteriovorax TaxID=2639665 RepID=UPI003714283C